MRKMLCCAVIALAGCCLIGCGKEKEPEVKAPQNPFIGKWTVNYDLTMEESKKSPKFQPELEQLYGLVIKNASEQVTLEITSDKMIHSKGDKTETVAYTVTSQSDDGKTLVATSGEGDEEAQITFVLLDDKHMNFKSTGTDDMDYYIWQRTEEEPTP